MSDLHEQPSRRPQTGPVLVTALGVLAILAIQQLLGRLVDFLGAEATADVVGSVALSLAQQIGLADLPFALGALLVLRLVAPVAPTTRIGSAIVRGLLAAIGGGIVVLIVELVVAFLVQHGGEMEVPHLIAGAVGTIVQRAPIVVLAAVLLWIWLQRHPLPGVLRSAFEEL